MGPIQPANHPFRQLARALPPSSLVPLTSSRPSTPQALPPRLARVLERGGTSIVDAKQNGAAAAALLSRLLSGPLVLFRRVSPTPATGSIQWCATTPLHRHCDACQGPGHNMPTTCQYPDDPASGRSKRGPRAAATLTKNQFGFQALDYRCDDRIRR